MGHAAGPRARGDGDHNRRQASPIWGGGQMGTNSVMARRTDICSCVDHGEDRPGNYDSVGLVVEGGSTPEARFRWDEL